MLRLLTILRASQIAGTRLIALIHCFTKRQKTTFGFLSTLILFGTLATPTLLWCQIETFFFDSGTSSPVSGSTILEQDVDYLIEIDGTYSVWRAAQWVVLGTCKGTPESSPVYPSSFNGPVGIDPAFIFAAPFNSSICRQNIQLPTESRNFEFNLGDGNWFTAEPIAPTLNVAHLYQYEVTGIGQPLQVRFLDTIFTDNYGQVRIRIFVANLPPSAEAGGPYANDEGSSIIFDGSASSDPDMDDLEYRWDFDNDGIFDTAFGDLPTAARTFGDNLSGQALLEVRDVSGGLTSTDLADFQVANLDPIVRVDPAELPRPEFALPGESIKFTGHFTDPGWEDSHTAEWDFGDGDTDSGTLLNLDNAPPDATGDVVNMHGYNAFGEFTIRLTVLDDDDGTSFTEVTINIASGEEAVQAIDDAIQELDDSALKPPAGNRKNTFQNKLQEVQTLTAAGALGEAIDKLQNDIRAKMDGCLGGNSKNDWIVDCDAQTQIAEMIDALVAYFETLQSGLTKLTLSHDHDAVPERLALFQNYPNPFNPETEIRFQTPEVQHVMISVYNTLGQEIRRLADEHLPAGFHSLKWDGKDDRGTAVASGVYIYKMTAGSFIQVRKMSLLR